MVFICEGWEKEKEITIPYGCPVRKSERTTRTVAEGSKERGGGGVCIKSWHGIVNVQRVKRMEQWTTISPFPLVILKEQKEKKKLKK